MYLEDLRFITDTFGVPDTFDFSGRHFDFETYFTLEKDFILCLTLSLLAVLIVVMLVTADIMTTILVTLMVSITDFFLIGSIHYLDLTFNGIVVLNVVLAVGTSVDYSTHIAYGYLTQDVPKSIQTKSNREIRAYKARMAMRSMGPSVFHGGFSTFTAIIFTSPSQSYIFVVFFRLWSSILFFGLANGLVLLPVILSFIGPTGSINKEESEAKVLTEESMKNEKEHI